MELSVRDKRELHAVLTDMNDYNISIKDIATGAAKGCLQNTLEGMGHFQSVLQDILTRNTTPNEHALITRRYYRRKGLRKGR